MTDRARQLDQFFGGFFEQEKSQLAADSGTALHQRLDHFFDKLLVMVEESSHHKSANNVPHAPERFAWMKFIEEAEMMGASARNPAKHAVRAPEVVE